MKFLKLWAVHLPLVLIGLTACAKRPHDENKEIVRTSVQPSVVKSIPKTLEDIRDAISLKRSDKVKQIILNTPELQTSHLNQLFNEGETLLTYAILIDASKVRDVLIEMGVDINTPNIKGETPLILSAKLMRNNSLIKLINEKAKLNEKDLRGNTALLWTIQNGQEDEALALISSGANVEITDNENKNALTYANEKSLTRVMELLTTRQQVDYGAADVNTFMSVISSGDYKTLNLMVTESPKIVRDYEDVNPLVLALGVKDENTATRMADFLLTYGANINGPANALTTPLIQAASLEKINFVTMYLDEHADPNLVDNNGKSALIYAVEKNNLDIVSLLIRHYADKKYSFKDKTGKKHSFNACTTARETYKVLDNNNELLINEKISERLGCGGFLWFLR